MGEIWADDPISPMVFVWLGLPIYFGKRRKVLKKRGRVLKKRGRVLKKRGRVLKKVCLERGTRGGRLLQKGGVAS